MGGIEDEEPPLKRIKISSPSIKKVSEDRTLEVPVGSGDILMAKSPSFDENETIGAKGLIRKVEFIKIITQALYSLGFKKSGSLLEEESGISFQPSTVAAFRQQILDGKWDDSINTLQKIDQLDSSTVKAVSFLIMEQKLFELVNKGSTMEALTTLRAQISPLKINTKRVHELASFLVFPSFFEESKSIMQGGSVFKQRMKMLQDIQKLLPTSVMIPEKRLESLVEQALSVQREACIFHNSLDPALSLYIDHRCGLDQIPTTTIQELESHDDEVWFLQFSNNGKYIASASKNCTAIIWEINEDNQFFSKYRLTGHGKAVSYVAWSPDDKHLLTCGHEECVKLWDVESGECKLTYSKPNFGMSSCGWFPDGQRVLCGGNDKFVYIFDLEGQDLDLWKGTRGPRVSDLLVTADGKHIISVWADREIVMYDLETKNEKVIFQGTGITSFCLSKDSKYLLVNLISQEIHLWDIENNSRLVKYRGHKHGRFVIRSCFGGSDLAFVVSGSEDSQVYIWHRGNGELLAVLPGHSGTVNCVSWNPVNPHMFASASDDHTIRIWGANKNSLMCNAFGNGTIHAENGGP
eukprot:TRINITY_DN23353_c0_g1_i1.p1 TRINITY_DN23353_c0_g1~~TRINITY_DN23353_c0_g1_i1.p1  ORF type:complete len:579 (-),score=101.75 TRINITY_DN23353_c0_g1_i1:159-1895(-)